MLEISVENGIFGILAFLVVGSLFLLHFLLFREYASQKKIQIQHLKDFEKLVTLEIQKSRLLSESVGKISEIEETTHTQLEVIKLQIKAIDLSAPKLPSGEISEK